MELTLEQALQKGIEAHKAGNAQEADRYYTAVLKANPKHPDANHNMGVLAVSVDKTEASLSFFKTALQANPSVAQFWLSYIDALIKLKRVDEAKAIFDQAKSKGAKGNGFDKLEERLQNAEPVPLAAKQIVAEPQPKRPNILNTLKVEQAIKLAKKKEREGYSEESKLIYQDILTKFPKNKRAKDGLKALTIGLARSTSKVQDPPQDMLEAVINLHCHGELQQALTQIENLVQQYPQSHILFNIKGAILKGLGKLEEAIEAYNKALAIKPDDAKAYNNMGVSLTEQGKLEEAMKAYNTAVTIMPYSAEVYNNIGINLKEQGKLEEAIEAYNKALAIKPDDAKTFNNLGNALKEQGYLKEAIEAYNKALAIKPDYLEAWNNIRYPLQAMKLKVSSERDLTSYFPQVTGSNFTEAQMAALNFYLNLGGNNAKKCLSESLNILAKANYSVIKRPKDSKNPTNSQIELTDKVVALVHWGRSGTGLLHSLIDSHPQVSTLPSIYLSEYFNHSIWERIISDGWSKMADRFMEIYDVVFDANSKVPVQTKSLKLLYNIGLTEGMASVGDQRNEVLSVDRTLFRETLQYLMSLYDELDAFLFFKLVHRAHDKAISNIDQKKLIFYHIHNPDTYAQLNFVRSVPNANWVMMVREPIQSCESWLTIPFQQNKYFDIVNNIILMLFEIDNVIYHRQNSVGVRLEDLKERPRQTIPALCNWMGIKETESLYEMTAQGKKWWGDPGSPDYTKDGMEPFGKTSINRKIGSVFSENDQFILKTLFYPFSARFGYVKENQQQFLEDLQRIRPMLDQMFDFEKKIAEQSGLNAAEFQSRGSYSYFRSGLFERYNTLKEFGTYPNIMKPLKVNA